MTIALQFGDAAQGGALSLGRSDKERVFRKAVRHSRLVRVMRVGIPLAIVLCIASVATYRWLDPMRMLAKMPIGADGMVISGTKIVMQQPRLAGFTKDERPYTIVARSAAKDLTNPDAMELQDVRATMVTQDRRDVQITAKDGLYNSKTSSVRLQNNVHVSSAEFEMALDEAMVETRDGTVVSDRPVEVRMLQGTINANRFVLRESGAVVRFERGVTLIIDREDGPGITGKIP